MNMDMAHLQSFLTVYRYRNVTRAAQELNISQPAVTAHLRALEAELKRPLFVRLPRGVAATALGDQLAREISDPLESLVATAQTFRPRADLERANLLLGGPADVLSEVILPSLAPLTSQGLSIRVRTGLTTDLIGALANRELDVVIATTPTRQRGVKLVPLFDETLALVLCPRLAQSISRSIDLRTAPTNAWPALLTDAPLIAFAENAPLVRRYWRVVFGLSRAPVPAIVMDDLRAIRDIVRSSPSWTVLPTYLIDRYVASGDLVVPLTPATPPTNTLYLAFNATTQVPHVTRVVEHLSMLRASPSTRQITRENPEPSKR
jgi:DNA-binding transcriptional LysR family regulator